jgi:hypothetical protein
MIAAEIGCAPVIEYAPRRPGDIDKSLLSPARILATNAWGPPVALDAGLRRLAADAAAVG